MRRATNFSQVMRKVVLIGHKSQGLDLKLSDLFVGRMKSSLKGMEVRNRCCSKRSGDLRIGVISYSNLVIAGSFRNSS